MALLRGTPVSFNSLFDCSRLEELLSRIVAQVNDHEVAIQAMKNNESVSSVAARIRNELSEAVDARVNTLETRLSDALLAFAGHNCDLDEANGAGVVERLSKVPSLTALGETLKDNRSPEVASSSLGGEITVEHAVDKSCGLVANHRRTSVEASQAEAELALERRPCAVDADVDEESTRYAEGSTRHTTVTASLAATASGAGGERSAAEDARSDSDSYAESFESDEDIPVSNEPAEHVTVKGPPTGSSNVQSCRAMPSERPPIPSSDQLSTSKQAIQQHRSGLPKIRATDMVADMDPLVPASGQPLRLSAQAIDIHSGYSPRIAKPVDVQIQHRMKDCVSGGSHARSAQQLLSADSDDATAALGAKLSSADEEGGRQHESEDKGSIKEEVQLSASPKVAHSGISSAEDSAVTSAASDFAKDVGNKQSSRCDDEELPALATLAANQDQPSAGIGSVHASQRGVPKREQSESHEESCLAIAKEGASSQSQTKQVSDVTVAPDFGNRLMLDTGGSNSDDAQHSTSGGNTAVRSEGVVANASSVSVTATTPDGFACSGTSDHKLENEGIFSRAASNDCAPRADPGDTEAGAVDRNVDECIETSSADKIVSSKRVAPTLARAATVEAEGSVVPNVGAADNTDVIATSNAASTAVEVQALLPARELTKSTSVSQPTVGIANQMAACGSSSEDEAGTHWKPCPPRAFVLPRTAESRRRSPAQSSTENLAASAKGTRNLVAFRSKSDFNPPARHSLNSAGRDRVADDANLIRGRGTVAGPESSMHATLPATLSAASFAPQLERHVESGHASSLHSKVSMSLSAASIRPQLERPVGSDHIGATASVSRRLLEPPCLATDGNSGDESFVSDLVSNDASFDARTP